MYQEAGKDFWDNLGLLEKVYKESTLNLCTGRPPTGVMIPDAV